MGSYVRSRGVNLVGPYIIAFTQRVKAIIPASVCMDDGYLHATYVELENGGKLFACAETMVALLMGGDEDVERKGPTRRTPEGKMTQTGWFGKDSRKYMADLIAWSLK